MILLQFAATAGLALCWALVVDRLIPRRNADRSRWPKCFAVLGIGTVAGLLGLLLARGL